MPPESPVRQHPLLNSMTNEFRPPAAFTSIVDKVPRDMVDFAQPWPVPSARPSAWRLGMFATLGGGLLAAVAVLLPPRVLAMMLVGSCE
jgi:hypothetical protein